MSNARPLWTLSVFIMGILMVLLLVNAPGNLIAGVLMIGCVVVIATVIAAGLDPQR